MADDAQDASNAAALLFPGPPPFWQDFTEENIAKHAALKQQYLDQHPEILAEVKPRGEREEPTGESKVRRFVRAGIWDTWSLTYRVALRCRPVLETITSRSASQISRPSWSTSNHLLSRKMGDGAYTANRRL